jgi:hypothetical protein
MPNSNEGRLMHFDKGTFVDSDKSPARTVYTGSLMDGIIFDDAILPAVPHCSPSSFDVFE